MGGALVVTTIVGAIFLLLFAKTFRWSFYMAGNNAYGAATAPLGGFPYPGPLAAFLFGSPVLQFILVSILALWFFDSVGSVFLSSTRVVFAAAFDRVLLEFAAKVSSNGAPYWALGLRRVRVQPQLPVLHPRRDARDRDHLPRRNRVSRDPAVAQAGDL
jgi:amino acid transporter